MKNKLYVILPSTAQRENNAPLFIKATYVAPERQCKEKVVKTKLDLCFTYKIKSCGSHLYKCHARVINL